MQEVFEKIVEKLESESHWTESTFDEDGYCNDDSEDVVYLHNAIEIVKQEAEKYNNGWIPCSEKLPELRQDVLVTVKYTGFMGMHGYWIKTGHMEAENDWCGYCTGGEVIAWQPLPQPYHPKGE